MTNNTIKPVGGSSGIPAWRRKGQDGTSREVSHYDPMQPGAAGAGQGNEKREWGRPHIPADPAPRFLDRKTEIHGCGVQVQKKSRVLTTGAWMQENILPIMDRIHHEMLCRTDGFSHRVRTVESDAAGLNDKENAGDPRADEKSAREKFPGPGATMPRVPVPVRNRDDPEKTSQGHRCRKHGRFSWVTLRKNPVRSKINPVYRPKIPTGFPAEKPAPSRKSHQMDKGGA